MRFMGLRLVISWHGPARRHIQMGRRLEFGWALNHYKQRQDECGFKVQKRRFRGGKSNRKQELHQGNLASNCIKTPKTARNLLS
mgnify:FL=1